jgi:predicted AAA+ superfamily ATPase
MVMYALVMGYVPRVVDSRLASLLGAMGGVVIEGARACGKTSTGLRQCRSSIRLDAAPQAVELAELDPASLLEGDTPRLIDEWQLAPSLWNVIRHEIDDRQEKGQFILSGSATPPDDVRRHSGAGRFGRMRMRTLTLSERGHSSGDVSFNALSDAGPLSSVRSPLTYRALADAAVVGGWPALLGASPEDAMDYNSSYIDDICSSDIPVATGIRRDPVRIRRLLTSLVRTISGEVSPKTLAADVSADGAAFDRGTVRAYLDALTRVFVLEELPPWSVALRSRTRLRQGAKMHLADPSLACAALGASPARLAANPEYFGQIFEAMAIHDIRVYAEAQRGKVYHYRDESGLEVDAIIEYPGAWAAIEIKLGSAEIHKAEANLLKLRDKRVDTAVVGEPSFLAILTGTEAGYTLPSGIHTIPLAALRA